MKRLLVLCFALATLASFACIAHAQVFEISTRKIKSTVTIFDNASDGRSVRIFLNGTSEGLVPAHGAPLILSFGGHISRGDQNIVITAQVCSAAREEVQTIKPPTWATDQKLLSGLALTKAYLESRPNEADLKHRVEEIKKRIHKENGAAEMKKELDAWRKTVKERGFYAPATTCEDPISIGTSITIRQDLLYNSQNQNVVLYLSGNAKNGYRFEQQGY